MVDEAKLEERIAALEREVAELRRRVAPTTQEWLARISGIVTDKEAFAEAMELSRAICRADQPVNGEVDGQR